MKIIISILIPNIIGFIGGIIGNSFDGMNNIITPRITPPSFIFPIAWIIIYTLMGISVYLINKKENTPLIYYIQLIINSLWSIFFFKLHWFLFSFIYIIFLIILVVIMIYKFYKINKISAYLNILYLVWLVFAAILSYKVFLIN